MQGNDYLIVSTTFTVLLVDERQIRSRTYRRTGHTYRRTPLVEIDLLMSLE